MGFDKQDSFRTFAKRNGGLAQLARALRWQRRGHGFESHTLHKNLQVQKKVPLYRLYDGTFGFIMIQGEPNKMVKHYYG